VTERPIHREALPNQLEGEQQDPRLTQAIGLLEQGIEGILTSEGFANYLRTQSKFHRYSFNNTILIMAQRPDATHVAGYRKWQELDHQVRKGERAIKIFVPWLSKDPSGEIDPRTGKVKEILTGYGIGNVFDIEQTDGEPLPEPPRPKELEGESQRAEAVYRSVQEYLEEDGVKVKRLPGKQNGLYRPLTKEVVVNFLLKGNQATKTMIHEAAHHVADHRGYIPREDAETVAESCAFVVMHHFGLDSGEYSFAYVAGWAENKDVLKRNLSAIQRTSRILIDQVEQRIERHALGSPQTFHDRPPSRDELYENITPPHLKRKK